MSEEAASANVPPAKATPVEVKLEKGAAGSPTAASGETRRESKTGYELIHIPAGRFKMGCVRGDSQCDSAEKPPHRETVAAFWLGKNDVTADAYARCVQAGACTAPDTDTGCAYQSKPTPPINCVKWDQAEGLLRMDWRTAPDGERVGIRRTEASFLRTSSRSWQRPSYTSDGSGTRCAQ